MKKFKNWPLWLKVGSVFLLVDAFFLLVLMVMAVSTSAQTGGESWEGYFLISLLTQPLIWIFGSFDLTNDLFLPGGGSALGVVSFFIVGIVGWFIIGSIIGLLIQLIKNIIKKSH